MAGNKVVIIGAGLGGLECGYVLAKCGMEVTVLERQQQIGGCMQSFHRNGCAFDTGMHYVGALGEGESLNSLFRYFGLMDLPWVQLDQNGFDTVVMGDEVFKFANGHRDFAEVLSERFPRDRAGLVKYADTLKQVGDNVFAPLKESRGKNLEDSLFGQSAYGFLNETISNPLLRKVLSGTSLKMELRPETLPLYTFAQINDSFIRSAWRLRGSGSQIGRKLADAIALMGGSVMTGREVTGICEDGGKVTGVMTGEEYIPADFVISDAHPAVTIGLLDKESCVRKAYRRRIAALENTTGMFTVNIRLKPDMLEYRNSNMFIHAKRSDPWCNAGSIVKSVMVSWPVPGEGDSSECLDLLTPMDWSEVARWADTKVGQRGEDYVQFKKRKAWECFRLVEKQIPQIWEATDKVHTSTPLTYSNYNLSPCGSAYGVRKDWHDPMMCVLTPRTPLQGLLLTGQSLNLHGVLGVTMTSLMTCAGIMDIEKIRSELKDYIY